MLAIDSLAKHFPNGVIALNDVDLAIDQSEIVSLVGTSGCGKSTLLPAMAASPSTAMRSVDRTRKSAWCSRKHG